MAPIVDSGWAVGGTETQVSNGTHCTVFWAATKYGDHWGHWLRRCSLKQSVPAKLRLKLLKVTVKKEGLVCNI